MAYIVVEGEREKGAFYLGKRLILSLCEKERETEKSFFFICTLSLSKLPY